MIQNKIHHICIQTDQYEASLSFYTKVLGFELVKETSPFHERDYNTWLKLDDFMIELQTGRRSEPLGIYEDNRVGIVHFCLYTNDFLGMYAHIKSFEKVQFKQKNGEDLYTVESGQLFKITAPEGTIIEIRNAMEL